VATPILICDDSSFAARQLARALPQDWDVSVSFADGGEAALRAIKQGKGDILFLDLNMPGMDGYAVLEAIRAQDLPTLAIVVSGDIQPEARDRVMKLGALDFVKKPVSGEVITAVLEKYGIHHALSSATRKADFAVDLRDAYKEIANVAMGRAADLLARLLGVFVHMPIPRVSMIDAGELQMTLAQFGEQSAAAGVCQGFIGAGVAGEVLAIFDQPSFRDIAELLKYDGAVDDAAQQELITDIANIVIGALLKGIGEQLDMSFSQDYPLLLGRHLNVPALLQRKSGRWTNTLAIEMATRIEERNVSCSLLLLFTEDSLDTLRQRVAFLAG
jgi:chemotaxis protein CheY-P-specific phosphatase CheC